ncbi:hypothetical protein ACVWZ6_007763 [Bradyrhizobium sp. GM6.1]
MRVAGDAIGRAHADEAGRELIHIGFAEIDRAGGDGVGDNRARVFRGVGEFRAGRGGLLVGHIDTILDREHKAVERQLADLANAGIERAGLRHDALRICRRDPDAALVGVIEARQHVRGDIGRLELAAAIGGAEVARCEIHVGHVLAGIDNVPARQARRHRP